MMLALLLPLFFLWSCQKKKETGVVYEKIRENFDATCLWLINNQNFHNARYMPVFYSYYYKKLKEGNYRNAADALEIVSVKKSSYLSFDDAFMQTIEHFSNHYRNKLPPKTTTFIDIYIGDFYSDTGNFRKAIGYYEKATTVPSDDYISCVNTANAFYSMSFCYQSLGDQTLAYQCNVKALEYYRKTGDFSSLGLVYGNFSIIYCRTKEYAKAEKSNDIAFEYHKKAKDTSNMVTNMLNKIDIYLQSGDKRIYDEIEAVYQFYNKSNLKDSSLKIAVYTYYTKKLLHEKKIAETKILLDGIKPEVEALNSDIATQDYNIAVAEYEVEKNNGILNNNNITKALPGLIANENYPLMRTYYCFLKENALVKKDYKSALLYEEAIGKTDDSLASREMAHKVLELDKKYQTEKKEQQIQIQEKTIVNKNTTIALLISLFMGLFLVVVIIAATQKQKKLRRERQDAQQYTKQLLEKTEEERKRIASDLHDSVSHELLALKNSFEEKTSITNEKIDAIINDIRIISRNLHPVMFDKIGLKASIEQLAERTESVNDFMVTSDIAYGGSLSTADELQLYRIIQEALSNIIKYANAMAAKITISENLQMVYVEIKDSGKGFNVNETFQNSNAFGLHNIIERSRAIGGQAKIFSDQNGTVITIEIKKQS